MLVLMLLVVISYLILRKVTDEKRDWSHLSGSSDDRLAPCAHAAPAPPRA